MSLDLAVDTLARWRADPVAMVRELFGVEPDAWQRRVLEAFPTNPRLAMKACKGPGKTCVLAWIGWNFLLTRPYPKIAATSISGDNLADGLWTEMAKWQMASPLLTKAFVWTKTRIFLRESPETWWMSFRTWPRSGSAEQQADTLAGLHADYLLFILDEAGGIPDSVMAAAEAGLATGVERHLLMAGNPTHLTGPLYRACTRERKLWYVIEITSDPDSPERTPRVSIEWARQQIEKYGKDNPWVLTNVYGQFPPSSINALLGPDDMSAAMGRHLGIEIYGHAAKVIGVDVADQGDDRTVLFPRQGLAAFRPVVMRNARPIQVATRIARAYHTWDADAVLIDDTGGWALGVMERLDDANIPYIPINFSGKADDPRYYNKRAEMHFLAAEWVKRGGALPDVPEIVPEATEPTYTIKNSQFLMEPKEKIKERIGCSPDHWDAFSVSFGCEVVPKPRGIVAEIQAQSDSGDYDPYANA